MRTECTVERGDGIVVVDECNCARLGRGGETLGLQSRWCGLERKRSRVRVVEGGGEEGGKFHCPHSLLVELGSLDEYGCGDEVLVTGAVWEGITRAHIRIHRGNGKDPWR